MHRVAARARVDANVRLPEARLAVLAGDGKLRSTLIRTDIL
jgi:hypothetical protein